MLDLNAASQIVDSALAHARREGLAPMTVAALDARGAIVALKMEDGSSLLRPEIASGEAWSALAMGYGTRNLAGRAENRASGVVPLCPKSASPQQTDPVGGPMINPRKAGEL
jgi:uncharacterized protein GlcG (DUF336 family)